MPTRVVDAGVGDSFPRDDFPRDNFPHFIMLPRAEGACRGPPMKRSGLFLTAAVAAAAISGAAGANATELSYDFTASGPGPVENASFMLDSNTTPSDENSGGFDFDNVQTTVNGIQGLDTIIFYSPAYTGTAYGELGIYSGVADYDFRPDNLLYGGPATNPTLVTGTFTTTIADGTLVVSTVSAAPEPSSWLLMIAGVAGIGCAFRYRARRGPQGFASV